jgi:hypothetical protein
MSERRRSSRKRAAPDRYEPQDFRRRRRTADPPHPGIQDPHLLLRIAMAASDVNPRDPNADLNAHRAFLRNRHYAALSGDFKTLVIDAHTKRNVTARGDVAYTFQDRFHRENDLPAVIRADGGMEWNQDDELHRDNDMPAVVLGNGDRYWYQRGLFHRDNDLPAFVGADGSQEWRWRGARHRGNDLPALTRADGYQAWYWNGVRHREGNKPSVIRPDGSVLYEHHGIPFVPAAESESADMSAATNSVDEEDDA